MSDISDTPRTDAVASEGWSGDAECVAADFARQLERELQSYRLQSVEGWRPIETAPRTGERILLATNVGGGRVSVGSGAYSCDPYRTTDDEVIGAEEGFMRDGDECIPSNQECFTHWQPLSSAPKGKVL